MKSLIVGYVVKVAWKVLEGRLKRRVVRWLISRVKA